MDASPQANLSPGVLTDLILQTLQTAASARRLPLTVHIHRACNGQVISGPFRTMRLPIEYTMTNQLAPMLLGVYEAELQPWVEAAINRRHDVIVNVGAAEGYYAVGLAMRVPQAISYAYDTDPAAQQRCRQTV